jgi:hypothetical protein
MTSLKQIAANRQNASKSTGPRTDEGKYRSRCNSVRHGLSAETVIGKLEDVEDYKAFEASITADYDVQSAVERELVLRLAGLLWRLRRATTIETGLFEIQAQHLSEVTVAYSVLTQPAFQPDHATSASSAIGDMETADPRNPNMIEPAVNPSVELARSFLRLANLPNCVLDRLSRYEAALWRQVGQILVALDALDRCNPQERSGLLRIVSRKRASCSVRSMRLSSQSRMVLRSPAICRRWWRPSPRQ